MVFYEKIIFTLKYYFSLKLETTFNHQDYLELQPDIGKKSYESAFRHWTIHGKEEGRVCNKKLNMELLEREIHKIENNIIYNLTPVITILTRTRNRPEEFSKLYSSVHNQSYKQINHIVSYDNDETLEYVTKYPNIEIIQMKNYLLATNENPAPHNLYINEMIKHIQNNGYVLILDDDDSFINNQSLAKMVSFIREKNDIIISRYWTCSYIIPNGEKFISGQLASCCVLFPINIYRAIPDLKMLAHDTGDFDFLNSIAHHETVRLIYTNTILTRRQKTDRSRGSDYKFDKNFFQKI